MIAFVSGLVTYTVFPDGALQLLQALIDTNVQILVRKTLCLCDKVEMNVQ